MPTGIIKVSNISKLVDSNMIEKLFSFIGPVEKVNLHQSTINPQVQEAIVEFKDEECTKPALFLTGTEIADRAIIITEVEDSAAISAAAAAVAAAAEIAKRSIPMAMLTAGKIPQPQISAAVATTAAAATASAHSMPLANPTVVAMMRARPHKTNTIPANIAAVIHPSILQFDPTKAEEISRTIYVGNIASSVSEQELMQFFSVCGPVAYVKMAGDGMQPTRFAFVEFADVMTAQAALQMNGMVLAERPLKVNHSKNAINKPPVRAPPATRLPTLAATATLPAAFAPAVTAPVAAAQAAAAAAAAAGTSGANAAAVLSNAAAVAAQSAASPRSGLAWPVLGNLNPVQASGPAGDAAPMEVDAELAMRKVREAQERLEEKYGGRSRSRRRSEMRESSAKYREHSAEGERRASRRHRRSPDRYSSRHRHHAGRAYARESGEGSEEDYYYAERSRRRPSRRDESRDEWRRRHRDYRSRSSDRYSRSRRRKA